MKGAFTRRRPHTQREVCLLLFFACCLLLYVSFCFCCFFVAFTCIFIASLYTFFCFYMCLFLLFLLFYIHIFAFFIIYFYIYFICFAFLLFLIILNNLFAFLLFFAFCFSFVSKQSNAISNTHRPRNKGIKKANFPAFSTDKRARSIPYVSRRSIKTGLFQHNKQEHLQIGGI